MSLTSDLRRIASAVEVQHDAFDQLHFCVRAYLRAFDSEDLEDMNTKLAQLREAVTATAPMLRR